MSRMELEPYLLYDRKISSTSTDELVMDRDGHLLRVRTDLRSCLSRLIAKGAAPRRTFEIGSIYRSISAASQMAQVVFSELLVQWVAALSNDMTLG